VVAARRAADIGFMCLWARWQRLGHLVLVPGLFLAAAAALREGDMQAPFRLDCAPGAGLLQCRWQGASSNATGYAFRIVDTAGDVLASGSLPYAPAVSQGFALPQFAGGTVRVEVRTEKGARASEPAVVEREIPAGACGCVCGAQP
jgi:hypothetical protein